MLLMRLKICFYICCIWVVAAWPQLSTPLPSSSSIADSQQDRNATDDLSFPPIIPAGLIVNFEPGVITIGKHDFFIGVLNALITVIEHPLTSLAPLNCILADRTSFPKASVVYFRRLDPECTNAHLAAALYLAAHEVIPGQSPTNMRFTLKSGDKVIGLGHVGRSDSDEFVTHNYTSVSDGEEQVVSQLERSQPISNLSTNISSPASTELGSPFEEYHFSYLDPPGDIPVFPSYRFLARGMLLLAYRPPEAPLPQGYDIGGRHAGDLYLAFKLQQPAIGPSLLGREARDALFYLASRLYYSQRFRRCSVAIDRALGEGIIPFLVGEIVLDNVPRPRSNLQSNEHTNRDAF